MRSPQYLQQDERTGGAKAIRQLHEAGGAVDCRKFMPAWQLKAGMPLAWTHGASWMPASWMPHRRPGQTHSSATRRGQTGGM